MIAEHCARLGFINFHLNDGDKVELSNLNRQVFSIEDIGSFKAGALSEKLLKINPLCNVSFGKTYVHEVADIAELIENSDIIINTIDCNKTYFDVIDYGRSRGKLVICPFNPGFGGLVIFFDKNSAASHEVFDIDQTSQENLNDLEIAKQLFEKYPQIRTPQQAGRSIDTFLKDVSAQGYFPQITIGALQTTVIVLTNIIKFLQQVEPILTAPHIFYTDSFS